MDLKPVYIKLATNKTPEFRVMFDEQNNQLVIAIRGRCIPENPIEFFGPVIERLKDKLKMYHSPKMKMDLDIEYINSISIKFLVKILNIFRDMAGDKKNLFVNWFFEDEDTYEVGADLAYITGLEFNFVEK